MYNDHNTNYQNMNQAPQTNNTGMMNPNMVPAQNYQPQGYNAQPGGYNNAVGQPMMMPPQQGMVQPNMVGMPYQQPGVMGAHGGAPVGVPVGMPLGSPVIMMDANGI
jgi:hypothetical protein